MAIRDVPSRVDEFFASHPATYKYLSTIIAENSPADGNLLVDQHINPMISWIYKQIEDDVRAKTLSTDGARFFVQEMSVFARYNSQFLKRAAESVCGFSPEFAHELMRNHLEEGGEVGRLPAHFVLYSGALIKDLDLFVNGYVPQAKSTCTLIWMHDTIVNSHCPSTILGMYYATEAVATAETEELRRITNRLGQLLWQRQGSALPNLDYYFRLHLDEGHEAASQGQSVEMGHQEGIAGFIRKHQLFGFKAPQIVDGFLQMLGPFVDQWTELCVLNRASQVPQILAAE